MELELKHIQSYPLIGDNKLQIRAKLESKVESMKFIDCEIVSINMLSNSLTIRHMVGKSRDEEYVTDKEFSDIKPILHSLSDLEKEINIDFPDEPFIPFEVLKNRGVNTVHGLLGQINDGSLRYSNMILLLQWHFNVFNLPEELYIKK